MLNCCTHGVRHSRSASDIQPILNVIHLCSFLSHPSRLLFGIISEAPTCANASGTTVTTPHITKVRSETMAKASTISTVTDGDPTNSDLRTLRSSRRVRQRSHGGRVLSIRSQDQSFCCH